MGDLRKRDKSGLLPWQSLAFKVGITGASVGLGIAMIFLVASGLRQDDEFLPLVAGGFGIFLLFAMVVTVVQVSTVWTDE